MGTPMILRRWVRPRCGDELTSMRIGHAIVCDLTRGHDGPHHHDCRKCTATWAYDGDTTDIIEVITR